MASFKQCVTCRAKFPTSDHHEECAFCLGESHNPRTCRLCRQMTPQALKNRILKLKAALWKQSLRAHPGPSEEAQTTPTGSHPEGKPQERGRSRERSKDKSHKKRDRTKDRSEKSGKRAAKTKHLQPTPSRISPEKTRSVSPSRPPLESSPKRQSRAGGQVTPSSVSAPPATSGPLTDMGKQSSKPNTPVVCIGTESEGEAADPPALTPHSPMLSPPRVSTVQQYRASGTDEHRRRTDSESEGRRSVPPSEPVGERSTDAWLSKFPEFVFDRESGSYFLKVQPDYLKQLQPRPSSVSRRRDRISTSPSPPRYRTSKRRNISQPSGAERCRVLEAAVVRSQVNNIATNSEPRNFSFITSSERQVLSECDDEKSLEQMGFMREVDTTDFSNCGTEVNPYGSQGALSKAEERSNPESMIVGIPEEEQNSEDNDNYFKSVSNPEEVDNKLVNVDFSKADLHPPISCRNISGYDKPHWETVSEVDSLVT
ncbi:hypothetical protein JD844_024538 [Phrynosoma platyrhinos]|uniref:Uncharacterized protein n=1 Tax=Phrynosoma platyrhinos TaxID=52577 RepID=A0ABQ7SXZ4_PHRPL|nr:hypothetical protein JD844_024538 [Phrynosoma platyrhinos]